MQKFLLPLEESSDRQDAAEGRVIPDADAVLVIRRVYDSSFAHIDGHVAVIADDISGLGVGKSVDGSSPLSDPGVVVRELDTEMFVHFHDKS